MCRDAKGKWSELLNMSMPYIDYLMPSIDEGVPLMPLYYTTTSDNGDFQPTEFVDISDEFETVADMLRRHESHLVWLKDRDGIDVVENQRTLAASLGMQCGVKYAKGTRHVWFLAE